MQELSLQVMEIVKKTELYLYYNDNVESNTILDLFVEEFPESNLVDWQPEGIKKLVKKTKPEQKMDSIIEYLIQQKAKNNLDVSLQEVIKATGINKSTMNRYTRDNYFLRLISNNNFTFKSSDGKSKHFILE